MFNADLSFVPLAAPPAAVEPKTSKKEPSKKKSRARE